MIRIYTDGSCKKNPGGKGTCAFVVVHNDTLIYQKSYRKDITTNNRMELSAVLLSILYVLEGRITDPVVIYTDSKYTLNGIVLWMAGWKKKGWIRKKESIPNRDLWEKIDAAVSKAKNIKFEWIKAHSINKWNNYADELCEMAYK